MSDLTTAAGKYRKAEDALEKARINLEQAIADDGWTEAHRHISDGKTVSVRYQRTDQDGNGEAKHFEEFAEVR